MLALSHEIKNRYGSYLQAKARITGFHFTMQNLETNEWFRATFDNLGEYNIFKEKLARLIYDKPGTRIGLDEVVLVEWKHNVSAQRHNAETLSLYIKRSGLKTGWFTLMISESNGKVALYSIELRREEIINFMDSITWFLNV